jgi:hypothetical protein
VTLSADGRVLIVAGERAGIWFFDARTGKELGWRKGRPGFGEGGLALTADAKTLAWVENEKYVELQPLQETLASCVKGRSEAQSDPPDMPLTAELLARQDRYVLNLGKRTPEEFSHKLTRLLPQTEQPSFDFPNFAFPSAPRVDLEFRVRNTGSQPMTFSPDLKPGLFLAGAGALNITWPCQTLIVPSNSAVRPVTLRPGETHFVRLTNLKPSGGSQCLWILPGEYRIYANCGTFVSPAPKEATWKYHGSGWITLSSPALKVKVAKAPE